VPVKAGGTEIEAIAAPTVTDVLESSWKWDGQGEQPQWELDSVRFRHLFPTYQAWYTLAYRPSVLAQMVSLPSEHPVFTELAAWGTHSGQYTCRVAARLIWAGAGRPTPADGDRQD
jgi:hypothetical protein